MSQVTSESILTTKEIVEQAIKDYHAQILPYLNGSYPTPIANKFDKANMYSTDEQIVGRWIDGKPVYQKTFSGVLSAKIDESIAHNISNVDLCIEREGFVVYDNATIPFGFYNGDVYNNMFMRKTTFEFRHSRAYANCPYKITVLYTKTTDSAIEIGSDTDYSTTEKVIGTWIDGKPLYQKSYELQNFAMDGLYHIIDSTMTNISVKKREIINNTWYKSPSDYSGFIVTDVDSSGLKLMYCTSYSGTINFVITLQYTKTTD